jgi:sugar phosphate permease
VRIIIAILVPLCVCGWIPTTQNGLGSIGAIFQSSVTSGVLAVGGWPRVFHTNAAFCALGTIALIPFILSSPSAKDKAKST